MQDEGLKPAVLVQDISKQYGRRGRRILQGVCLEAAPGEQTAIIGRNGSGKSTLLQIMAGILKPDAGTVQYYGTDIVRQPRELIRLCGYLPQANPLAEELSVEDNLSLWSGKLGRPDLQGMEIFHLQDILHTPVYKLSGGMKRRVSIACAVIHKPPVLIMDEPTAALDIYYQREIRDWMAWYRKGNGTIIVATHNTEEIRQSSRVFRMENGTLIQCEPQQKRQREEA